MSNTIYGLCAPLQMSPTQKSVLLALADAASDAGYCWIAVESKVDSLDLMKKTCLSKRAVQAAIVALQDLTFVQRDEFRGEGAWFVVTPPGFEPGQPPRWLREKIAAHERRAAARLAKLTPAGDAPPTPAPPARTPAAAAVNPSLTQGRKVEAKASPSSSAATRRNTAPDDWEPKDSHREKVSSFGWPSGMLEEQADRFKEWEFREAKTDFDRAFHRWLRTENDRLKGRGHGGASSIGGGAPARGGPKPREERIGAMHEGAMAALDRFQRERGPSDPDDFPI